MTVGVGALHQTGLEWQSLNVVPAFSVSGNPISEHCAISSPPCPQSANPLLCLQPKEYVCMGKSPLLPFKSTTSTGVTQTLLRSACPSTWKSRKISGYKIMLALSTELHVCPNLRLQLVCCSCLPLASFVRCKWLRDTDSVLRCMCNTNCCTDFLPRKKMLKVILTLHQPVCIYVHGWQLYHFCSASLGTGCGKQW